MPKERNFSPFLEDLMGAEVPTMFYVLFPSKAIVNRIFVIISVTLHVVVGFGRMLDYWHWDASK